MLGYGTTKKRATFDGELFSKVKAQVDCRLLVADDGTRDDFGDYVRQGCIFPDHPDSEPTLRIYADGFTCPGCDRHGDAVDLYQFYNPGASNVEAARALMENPDIQLVGEAKTGEKREKRELDPDLATRYHLALVETPEALAGLVRMGFTTKAIQHYRLGWARVLARLKAEEGEELDEDEFEWREDQHGKPVPYQWQWRYSVPVFAEGKLRQVVYRKADDSQLGGKTTMEKGAGAHLFGRDELEGARRVIVCEGWGDKIVAWQWGEVAVTSTNGAGHWNREWNELLAAVPELYVVGDADNAGQKLVDKVKTDLPWARPLILPWEMGSKMDLRDGAKAGWTRNYLRGLMRQSYVRGSILAMTRG